MNRTLLLALSGAIVAGALVAGCSKTDKPAAGAAQPAPLVEPAPTVVAPKPPAPKGGGKEAPELSPEDREKILKLLKRPERLKAAPVAPAGQASSAR